MPLSRISLPTRRCPTSTPASLSSSKSVQNLSLVLEKKGILIDLSSFQVFDDQDYLDLISYAPVATSLKAKLPIDAPKAKTSDTLETVHVEDVASLYPIFDDAAHDFVVFLLMKKEDAQQSIYNGEVILVDTSAFEGANVEIYARSWSFDDGSILSTVGSKSDFEVFGLIV